MTFEIGDPVIYNSSKRRKRRATVVAFSTYRIGIMIEDSGDFIWALPSKLTKLAPDVSEKRAGS
jgi:hypothetical protein